MVEDVADLLTAIRRKAGATAAFEAFLRERGFDKPGYVYIVDEATYARWGRLERAKHEASAAVSRATYRLEERERQGIPPGGSAFGAPEGTT